ncbi:MAG: purine-nucleoside phosphorylase [Bradymonadia bacterium]
MTDNNQNDYELIDQARERLSQEGEAPALVAVLGSGLGAFSATLDDRRVIPFGEIPGFPEASVTGHAGELVLGRVDDRPVAVLSGRVHLYEGHTPSAVVRPLRSLAAWGVKGVLITNASGGIHPDARPGDLMVITDHINLTGQNPLTGPNDARIGVRFPDMSTTYPRDLRDCIQRGAAAAGLLLRMGVYAGVLGPSYETPAEVRMLRTLGADAVGMSTVHEVIAAHHAGMRCAGISCITNAAAGLSTEALTHEDVKAVAARSRSDFIKLLQAAIPRLIDAL